MGSYWNALDKEPRLGFPGLLALYQDVLHPKAAQQQPASAQGQDVSLAEAKHTPHPSPSISFSLPVLGMILEGLYDQYSTGPTTYNRPCSGHWDGGLDWWWGGGLRRAGTVGSRGQSYRCVSYFNNRFSSPSGSP